MGVRRDESNPLIIQQGGADESSSSSAATEAAAERAPCHRPLRYACAPLVCLAVVVLLTPLSDLLFARELAPAPPPPPPPPALPPDRHTDPPRPAAAVRRKRQPHLIYFLIDDLGFADFPLDSDGGEGGSSSMTPAMDGLSRDGVRLTRFYTHSMCTASRASLLTGRYAFRLGLQHWVLTKESEWALPASEVTLAERLRDVGYSCHILGKWHLGHHRAAALPHNRGFDSWLGFALGVIDHWTHEYGNGPPYPRHADFDLHDIRSSARAPADALAHQHRCVRGNSAADPAGNCTYTAALLLERAQQLIADAAVDESKAPLFLYYATSSVHWPLSAPPEYIDRCRSICSAERRTYCAQLRFVDEEVRNMSAALRAAAMWDDTVLIVSSDNGGLNCEFFGDGGAFGGPAERSCSAPCTRRDGAPCADRTHPDLQLDFRETADGNPNLPLSLGPEVSAASNAPLRGRKHQAFEGGVRTHAFLSGGVVEAAIGRAQGRRYHGLVFIADFHVIFASLGGASLRPAEGAPLDGLDLWPALVGASEGAQRLERREVVAQLDAVDGSTAIIRRIPEGSGLAPGLWKLLLDVQDAPNYPPLEEDAPGCPEPAWHCGQHGWSGGNGSCLEGGIVDRLYELDGDPAERRDRFGAEPGVVAHLRERLGVARARGVVPYCGGCTRRFWRGEATGEGVWGVRCCGDVARARAAAVAAGGVTPWVD